MTMATNKLQLKFYVFDWDDNVLCMNSRVFVEKYDATTGQWLPTSLTTQEYANSEEQLYEQNGLRFPKKEDGKDDYAKAFVEFSDIGNTSNRAFLSDCIDAISNNQYGQSYNAFKRCLLGGHLFMICTARGHNPQTIKEVVLYIIDNHFTEDEQSTLLHRLAAYYEHFRNVPPAPSFDLINWYLQNNLYIGVSSPYFKNNILSDDVRPAVAKGVAVDHFIDRVCSIQQVFSDKIERINIGVSDDCLENLDAMVSVIKQKELRQDISYLIYDTSKDKAGESQYNKIKIEDYEPRKHQTL